MVPTRLLRRPRVLIVGCGDVGLQTLPLLLPRFRVLALSRQPARDAGLRAAGAQPVRGDLDTRRTLRRAGRLAASAFAVLHFAPPQREGVRDLRTAALLAALGQGSRRSLPPVRFIYASTTGVYGDCGGALIDETRPPLPANGRAVRRISAEAQLRDACRRGQCSPSILRIPGIYARHRLPEARLQRGTPALRAEDDVYTSHIHTADLARIALQALWYGRSQRLYHASDDSRMRMGAYFAMVADALGLPPPPLISRAEAEKVIEPTLMSFMRESRQLCNERIKRELGVTLRYPTVAGFLSGISDSAA